MSMEQEQRITIERLQCELAQAEDMAREASKQLQGETAAPGIIRSAMALCEACAGLPELSINRCPMCRALQAAL
jgi:hypothetical protein